MANYIQYEGSVQGSSYFQGLIYPWDEYVLVSTSSTTSILVVGTFEGVSDNTLTFKDSTIYTVTRGTNVGSTYDTSVKTENTTTIHITEPYYSYSNTFSGSPSLACTNANSVMAYFVCFAVMFTVVSQIAVNIIKSLLRRVSS